MASIVVIDVGTQSIRAILYKDAKEEVFETKVLYSPIFNGIEVEQDPRTWKDGLYKILKETNDYANKENITITHLSVTSQRASIIPIDKNGKVLYNAITWQDRRSYEQVNEVTKKMSKKEIYLKTGLRLDSYFSAPKIMWLKENMPDIYYGAHKIIGVQDYVVYLLTEKFITDSTQAARTLFMDINTFEWDDQLINVFGINKDLLPTIVKPGSIAGKITKQITEKTGLNSNIEVILAGGDQQCAAVGLNVLKPGTLEANIGTGSFVIAYSDKPVFDENMRVLCSASAVKDKWIVEAGLLTSGAIYTWYNEKFYGKTNDYEEINKEVNESKPGANELLLIPHFKGSAAPYWNPLSKAMFFNASFDHFRGDYARAILEGIALEMGENIKLIEELIDYVDIIYAAGGLTKFPTFNQIMSDVFNKAVAVLSSAEATAMGALIQARVGLKIDNDHLESFNKLVDITNRTTYHAKPKNIITYRRMLRTKKHLYDALNDSQIYSYINLK